jgi:hypothetical protein
MGYLLTEPALAPLAVLRLPIQSRHAVSAGLLPILTNLVDLRSAPNDGLEEEWRMGSLRFVPVLALLDALSPSILNDLASAASMLLSMIGLDGQSLPTNDGFEVLVILLGTFMLDLMRCKVGRLAYADSNPRHCVKAHLLSRVRHQERRLARHSSLLSLAMKGSWFRQRTTLRLTFEVHLMSRVRHKVRWLARHSSLKSQMMMES